MALAAGDVVLWYDIDEGSGTTLDNAEGTASRDGTQSGCTWTTGGPTNIPDALDLVAGATDHVSLNNTLNQLVGTANDFSISVWMKIDSITSACYLVNDWGASGSRSILWRVLDTNKDMQFYVSDNGTASELQCNVTGVSTSAYENYIITRSGNNTEIFKNGSSVATNTGSFTLIDSGTDLLFGQNPALNDNDFDGQLAQLIVFNKALIASEAGEVYNSGSGTTYASLFSGSSPSSSPSPSASSSPSPSVSSSPSSSPSPSASSSPSPSESSSPSPSVSSSPSPSVSSSPSPSVSSSPSSSPSPSPSSSPSSGSSPSSSPSPSASSSPSSSVSSSPSPSVSSSPSPSVSSSPSTSPSPSVSSSPSTSPSASSSPSASPSTSPSPSPSPLIWIPVNRSSY